jgi:hypothetical protein
MLQDKFRVIEDCKNLKWEMFNYIKITTRSGERRLPKKDDHAIDCLRYALLGSYYRLEEHIIIEGKKDDMPWHETPEQYAQTLTPFTRLLTKWRF